MVTSRILYLLIFLCSWTHLAQSQHSVARIWNEALLDAIRNDFARPTVHARNLFHISAAMYDAWTVFDGSATPYFLGQTVRQFSCPFEGFTPVGNIDEARNEAISFTSYRLLTHRFQRSPGLEESQARFDSLFTSFEYNPADTSRSYQSGSGAALGNYIASCIIDFGMQDGANERFDYANFFYNPSNIALIPSMPGNPLISDPNRWQPLSLDFIDQAGNPIPVRVPPFLSAEWGQVSPFALTSSDLNIYERNGDSYWVYHDPGPPAYTMTDEDNEEYAWGFSLVALWSSHLEPDSSRMIDISPASIGNIDIRLFPQTIEELRFFYDYTAGGDPGEGYFLNPVTRMPYEPQVVPLGDYARVLAEFWADGPESETPPGHWFTILNYVTDHPLFERRYKGEGESIDPLEWDVKAYFALGGAVHDAAITAWGIKGWYDYIRPVSAIRYMADQGQRTDSTLSNYSPEGIPLVPGYIELVEAGDPLAGDSSQHIGKIKLYAWKGPDFIEDPFTDVAGVDWILAENWWPYQRPSFITPPFAGYISGHSTFSRAAAEIMTLLTGDPFFPGGIGEFHAPQNEFLVFEDGPSVDITLQWATYRDASDQTSLSRIWGGIHPPVDDIPGRIIGERVGLDAFALAERYFSGERVVSNEKEPFLHADDSFALYPNPVRRGGLLTLEWFENAEQGSIEIFNVLGQRVFHEAQPSGPYTQFTTDNFAPGLYILRIKTPQGTLATQNVIVSN
ncbi:MAG: T9SS type A sorting domain-containing protein [Rhodothermaceae bacterium]|nr:T9SS type A sorting domain-containing protein [Rhodothermaceae bacterium]